MKTKFKKISETEYALIIPEAILDLLKWDENTTVEITTDGKGLFVYKPSFQYEYQQGHTSSPYDA